MDHSDPMRILEIGYGEAVRKPSSCYVRKECKKHNLPLLTTGGKLSADETYDGVCKHFGFAEPYLFKYPIFKELIDIGQRYRSGPRIFN